MARLKKELMTERTNALQDLLEDNLEGLTVNELVEGLKTKGISLPTSEYQSVHIVLKQALKDGIIVKIGKKFKLLDEDEVQEASEPPVKSDTTTVSKEISPVVTESVNVVAETKN